MTRRATPMHLVALALALLAPAPMLGQPPRAADVEALERTARRAPGDYVSQMRVGIAYIDADRPTDAFIALHKARAIRPEAAEPHFYLGLVYFQRGLLRQEIQAYREALERDPDHVGARLNLGHALIAAGEIQDAVDAYREVVKREVDNLAAIYNLGILFAEAGDVEAARGYLLRFLALAPPSDPWRTVAQATLREVAP